MIHKFTNLRINLLTAILWIIPLLIYLTLIFVIGPLRGAPWFSDDGLFLRMSFDAASGYGWDKMLPQQPSYLFNAVLMKLGMTELLQFRAINYSLCFFSSTLFFIGLDERGFRSNVVPIAIAASLLVYLNSVESPNSLALHFFMIGAGCYFFALRSSNVRLHTMLVISAIAFAVCGFMHAAVAIAVLLIGCFIYYLDPRARKSSFIYILLPLLIGLWAWYVSEVGLSTILKVPAAHETSVLELLRRIYLIFKFPLVALAYFIVVAWIFKKYDLKRFEISKWLLMWSTTALVIASLFNNIYAAEIAFPKLIDQHQLPGAIYYSLFFVIFSLIFSTYGANPKSQFSLIRKIYDFINGWIKVNNPETHNYKLLIAVIGFLLLPAGLAAGSNTAILVGLVYFSGPALGLILMLEKSQTTIKKSYQIYGFIFIWIVIFTMFTCYYNHPGATAPINNERVLLKSKPLNGVMESRQYSNSLQDLKKLYEENNCSKKLMFTMDNIPTVYYIFQHHAPNDIGVVRPLYYFPEKQIFELLESNSRWCVIDITSLETSDGVKRVGIDKREEVRKLIKLKSTHSYTIQSPGEGFVGDLIFYVR